MTTEQLSGQQVDYEIARLMGFKYDLDRFTRVTSIRQGDTTRNVPAYSSSVDAFREPLAVIRAAPYRVREVFGRAIADPLRIDPYETYTATDVGMYFLEASPEIIARAVLAALIAIQPAPDTSNGTNGTAIAAIEEEAK